MKRQIDPRLWLAIALAILVTVVGGVVGVRSVEYLFTATADAAHARTVLLALDQVLSTAKDAETGQRGFIITGDSLYLAPYLTATATIGQRVRALDTLTAAEPSLHADLPRLRALLTAKLEELRQTVALRAASGFAAAEAVVRGGLGISKMDTIREQVQVMTDEERRLLALRTERASRERVRTILVLLLQSVLELLTLAFLVRAIRRHIAARDRARATLFGQKETFRTTLASIGDAVITTDTRAAVTFLNPVAEALTGWATASAHGQPLASVFNIVNETTRSTVMNPALRALSEGVIVGLANHTVLIARDGSECPIDDSAAPIRDADGIVTGAVLVFRDIREKKAAERSMLDAHQRKDEFLAVLAHELRNPLAPLRNALEILRLSQHDPRAVAQVGGMMERQLGQMVRLIDDLLDVSRITRNRLELRCETIDVAQAVHAAIETCGPLLHSSRHALNVTLPPDAIYVYADSTRLTQAFGNLLSNAIKYTDGGGQISLSLFPDAGHVSITVRDSGVGIPAEMLDVIFDMFVQVDRSLERTRGGLGLGLPLVKHIIELHQGTITARSAGEGRGSEFVVRLPTVPAPSTRTPIPIPVPPPLGRRILVADDNVDAAESLAAMLRMQGHEVCIAHDGVEALREGERFRPELALLDIGMPHLNGFDAARQIRASTWGRTILLIALTGWGQESDRQQSDAAGFDHHFVKPIDATALNAILHAASR